MHSPQQSSTILTKIVLLLFFACLASIYLINGTLAPSIAQSTERELVDEIPKHLPIKVRIKKEKEKVVKDLKNENWLRDFQLEITNTGNKPIYFLSLAISLPEIKAPNGPNIGFSIHYGRGELMSIETRAEADDVPIKPGETYVFKFPDITVESWERFRQRENKPDAKKLRLRFQILSFGDRTGFVGTTGLAMPRAPDAKLGPNRCAPEPGFSDSRDGKGQWLSPRRWPEIFSTDDLPASFLLANFLSTESSRPTSINLKPQSGLCDSGNQPT